MSVPLGGTRMLTMAQHASWHWCLEEEGDHRAQGGKSAASCRPLGGADPRPSCIPHTSGLFLKFKAKWTKYIHRWTSNRVLFCHWVSALWDPIYINHADHWVLFSVAAYDSLSFSYECGMCLKQDSSCSSWIQAIKTHGKKCRLWVNDSHISHVKWRELGLQHICKIMIPSHNVIMVPSMI